jgi:acetate---CoA ligase (ADP-forming)
VDESGVTDKPVTISFVGGEQSEKAMRWLVENGIPAYGAPDVAVNAIAGLREYARMKAIVAEGATRTAMFRIANGLRKLSKARKDGRDSLTEIEAKEVFSCYGLPVTHTSLAVTKMRRSNGS